MIRNSAISNFGGAIVNASFFVITSIPLVKIKFPSFDLRTFTLASVCEVMAGAGIEPAYRVFEFKKLDSYQTCQIAPKSYPSLISGWRRCSPGARILMQHLISGFLHNRLATDHVDDIAGAGESPIHSPAGQWTAYPRSTAIRRSGMVPSSPLRPGEQELQDHQELELERLDKTPSADDIRISVRPIQTRSNRRRF